MLKKTALICVVALLISSAGLAYTVSNSTTPDSSLYPLRGLIEECVMDLTQDNVQTALWALTFAESRMNMVEDELENGRPDFVEDLLSENEALILRAETEIDDVPEDNEELEDAVQKVTEAHERRTERLQNMIAHKDLPEGAVNGIMKAMENQERAYQNFLNARNKTQENRENDEDVENRERGNDDDDDEDEEDEENNKPDTVPPVKTPVEIPDAGNQNRNRE